MNEEKKLSFLRDMTHMALTHAASTPNVPTPMGGMSHDKMLAFVEKLSKHGLQHFDAGGTALTNATAAGPQQNVAGQSFTGAIGNFLGTNNQYQAQAAPIQAGTNTAQLNNAYTAAQGALGTQGNITNTLNGGLNQGANTQGTLTNTYLNQINGTGPNPALTQLNQSTGQNIAQQAALAAGQRGAGANAGLLAAQNAQQGAATQQNAVGQAATLQAQQQLAAEGNLQNLASSQVAQGTGATQTLNNAQQNEQNILQGANTSANNENVSQQSNINNVNAGISTENANSNGNIISGIGNSLSNIPVIGSFLAKGGTVKKESALKRVWPHIQAGAEVAHTGISIGHTANHLAGLLSLSKGGDVLDANARAHIAPHNFALPGGRYPIHDINHARNALARVSQNGSPEEKAKVRAAVHKKYPGIGKKKMADGGNVTSTIEELAPLALMALSKGGSVKKPQMMASGGLTGMQTAGPQSFVGQWLNSNPNTQGPGAMPMANIDTEGSDPLASVKKAGPAAKPDTPTAEEGNNIVDPSQDQPLQGLGVSNLAAPSGGMGMLKAYGGDLKSGGSVGGKAKVNHDSLKNDTVPAMLSPGEVVIDKDTMNDPGPIGQMARAIQHHISKRNKGK